MSQSSGSGGNRASNQANLIGDAFEQMVAARVVSDGRLPAAPADPRQAVPGYRILGESQRGGQGVVYRAVQESTRRTVALKVMHGGAFAGPNERARFAREVQVLAELRHPNIVAIHDSGVAGDAHFFVMDYIEGRPLDRFVKEGNVPLRERLRLFARICSAVNAAHLRGILHRDLKPGNIRIDEQGEPHVLDFGLAKHADWGDSGAAMAVTMTGQFLGSLPWASPEQARGVQNQIDLRTDVYSLGVVLYQLLTGSLPYDLSGGLDAAIHNIVHADPVDPRSRVRGLDDDLVTIVLKALRKEPEQRYETAGALGRDVERHLAGEAIEAKRDSFSYVLGKFMRRNRAVVLATSAVALTLVAATCVSILFAVRESAALERQKQEHARAEAALKQEARQRALAEVRARETGEVADFQSQMLAEVDPQAMGIKLRADLLAKVRLAAERSNVTPEERDARVLALETLLADVDLTGLALSALDENVFQGGLAAIETQFSDQPLVKAKLLHNLANSLRELGLLSVATRPQQQALDIRRRELGDAHPDTLATINNMSELLRVQGNFREAEGYAREAMDASRRVLGDEHPDTLVAINNMGGLLEELGEWPEAEAHYREALDRHRRVRGDDHPDTLTFLNNLASVLQSRGKLKEAEPLYREALEKHRRVLGEEHPNTLRQLNNMASVLKDQGRLSEAESFYREALEKRRRVLGDEHPNTLTTLSNLSGVLQSLGELEEAERYARESVETRTRALGDEHPDTLGAIAGLGSVLRSRGKLADTEPFYREVLEKRRRLLGDDHPDTLLAINNLGVLLKDQGKLEEAEPYYREALEKYRALGEDHPGTLRQLNNMASLLKAQRNMPEAEAYQREAMERHRRVLGDDHPHTLLVIHNMGTMLRDRERFAEARALIAEALAGARKRFSGDHPQTAMYLHHLAEVLHRLGEQDEALQLVQESLAMYRQHADWGPGEYRHALDILLTISKDRGRKREAADTLREKADVQRSSLPADSLELASALALIGSELLKLEDYVAAADVVRECLSIRNKLLPDEHPQAYLRYNAMSMLGELLVGVVANELQQPGDHEGAVGRLHEAEESLLAAYAKLQNDPAVPPPTAQRDHKREVLEHIVKLYDTWHAVEPDAGYAAKAAGWRAKLADPAVPSSQPE